ncbi:MAG: hypothetical protein WC655_06100 [Candidatus Hydrogenedentales bacterium]
MRSQPMRSAAFGRVVCVLGVVAASAAAYAGAQAVPLTASPDTVTFSRMDDSAEIRLMSGDAPLASEAVKSARIMIDARDYSEQFVITRSSSGPAVVTLRPNPATAQVGSFSLRIATTSGEVKVSVLAPFDTLPDMIENQAKAKGITVEQLKQQLGMTKSFGRDTVSVLLPESFPEGHVFKLSFSSGNDSEFTWSVDGDVVQQGAGKSELSHVFEKPGEHVLSLVEKKGKGTVASWEGVLNVVAAKPLVWSVPAKTEVTVPGPEGFKKYTWRVDNEVVSSARVLKHTFKAKGQSTIECLAEQPEQGNPAEFRRLTWETTVK